MDLLILSLISLQVLETEETRELVKVYALLVGQLADFENEKIEVPLHQKYQNGMISVVPSTFLSSAYCWIWFACGRKFRTLTHVYDSRSCGDISNEYLS